MRRLPGFALLFFLACATAQANPPAEWLAFQEELKVFAAGPTGLYAAQDNPALPALRQFKGLAYFPYDPRGEVQASFRRNEVPTPVNYLDSRDQQGVMYDVGSVAVQIEGQPYSQKAFSYRKSWDEIDELLVLLKDRTSGKTTYGGGREGDVSLPKDDKDPKGAPVQTLNLNLSMAYSFLCAHSSFYNCPLVLTSYVDADLNFGEKYPPAAP